MLPIWLYAFFFCFNCNEAKEWGITLTLPRPPPRRCTTMRAGGGGDQRTRRHAELAVPLPVMPRSDSEISRLLCRFHTDFHQLSDLLGNIL
jgi:hypothetical protein